MTDSEKRTLLIQVDRLLSMSETVPQPLSHAIMRIIQHHGIWKKETLMLLRYLPEPELIQILPFVKEEFRKACSNYKSICFEGLLECCLRLRVSIKNRSNSSLLTTLQLLEGLLESCFMIASLQQAHLNLQSLYCEYLLLQTSIQGRYYYIPHDSIIQILLLSQSAIVINAVCLYIHLSLLSYSLICRMKIITQQNPNCGFLTDVNRLEGILRMKFTTSSIFYSSVNMKTTN